ncbi:MAG: glycosyltransferase family A protein, partial [Desulfobacterales bacterium]|nr:glycosyltransferase family A protein [Desulfobacterales bacterium]
FKGFEFLIVNDCSTDESRQVILGYQDPRIRLIDNPENLNQTLSLNRGLSEIQTELVARMDADDVSHPKRLERQMQYLAHHPEMDD